MTENAAQPPFDNPPATSLFVRPREGRLIAGVCAGVADRWRLDVTLVRIITVVLALVSGVGVALYLAAWLLTPSDDGPAPLHADSPLVRTASRQGERLIRRLPALVLIGLAALAAVALVHSLWFGVPVGLVVVLLLVAVLAATRPGRWIAAIIALLLAASLAVIGAVGPHLGTRTIKVTSADQLSSAYDYGVGTVKLDLTGVTTLSGDQHTDVRLGRGAVTVTVPPGLPVFVHARSGLGSVTVNGQRTSGIDAEQSGQVGAPGSASGGQLTLDVVVGAGSITIR